MKYVIFFLTLMFATSSFAFLDFFKKKRKQKERTARAVTMTVQQEGKDVVWGTPVATQEQTKDIVSQTASRVTTFGLPYIYKFSRESSPEILKFSLDPQYTFEFRSTRAGLQVIIFDMLREAVFNQTHANAIGSYFFENFMICFTNDGSSDIVIVRNANNPSGT